MQIRPLDSEDRGYALWSWQEAHKKAPGCDRAPWWAYKREYADTFKKIVDDPTTVMLGAYSHDDKLIGWLVMTPGKRVSTLHWVHVKFELDGKRMRRRGAMLALLEEAGLTPRFAYTLRARRDRATLPDGSVTKSLDESLVAALRARGVTAVYVPMKEWLR